MSLMNALAYFSSASVTKREKNVLWHRHLDDLSWINSGTRAVFFLATLSLSTFIETSPKLETLLASTGASTFSLAVGVKTLWVSEGMSSLTDTGRLPIEIFIRSLSGDVNCDVGDDSFVGVDKFVGGVALFGDFSSIAFPTVGDTWLPPLVLWTTNLSFNFDDEASSVDVFGEMSLISTSSVDAKTADDRRRLPFCRRSFFVLLTPRPFLYTSMFIAREKASLGGDTLDDQKPARRQLSALKNH